MKNKSPYFIDPKGFFGIASVVCMILAIVLRVVGEIMSGIKFNGSVLTLVNSLILPAACCLLFILCIVFFGKKGFWTSIIPVALAASFFVQCLFTTDNFGSFQFDNGYISAFIPVYILIACFYSATVTGGINKWIMTVIMALGIAYHVAILDYPVVVEKAYASYSLILELGILFMFLGVLFAVLGLKRRYIARPCKEGEVAPPVPGDELSGGLPAPVSEPEPKVEEEKKPEKEEKPAEEEKTEEEKEEIDPEAKLAELLARPTGLTLEPDLTREIEPEPERSDAQVPSGIGDKLRGLFGKKTEEEAAEVVEESKPDISNVIDAINDDISDDKTEEKDDF